MCCLFECDIQVHYCSGAQNVKNSHDKGYDSTSEHNVCVSH